MYGPATKNAAAAPRVMVAAMVLMRVMPATPSTSSLLTLTTLRSGAARGTGTRDRLRGDLCPDVLRTMNPGCGPGRGALSAHGHRDQRPRRVVRLPGAAGPVEAQHTAVAVHGRRRRRRALRRRH